MASNATATVADTVSPEVLAQVAAAARQAAIPVASEHGNATAAPSTETLSEWASRLLTEGTAAGAQADIDAAERDIDAATERIREASDRLTGWVRFAQSCYAQGVDGKSWKTLTGATGQDYGRLRSAGDLFDAYVKRGSSFALTIVECKRLADSKGVTKVATIVAEVRKRIDPIGVRGYRAEGKRIPGNAAIVAGSLAPAPAPSQAETPTAPVDAPPVDAPTGDAPPALSTPTAPVAPNGSTNTSEVFVMPAPAEWLRIVESMAAQADRVAVGQRERLAAAAETLHAALLAL